MEDFSVSIQRFDEFANEYASRFMNIGSYLDSIDEFCNNFHLSAPRILELACGPGNVTKYLKNRFPESEILAVDLAPNMLEIAKKNVVGVDFRVMDVRDISGLNKKFDLIMCSFCLPFLSLTDTAKLITDCSQLLNKNGRLYISTMEGEEDDAGFESTSFSGNSQVYFNYHTQKNIEKMLMESGFRISCFKKQDFIESDESILVDLIFIGIKD